MSLSKLLPKISSMKREDPFASPPAITLNRTRKVKHDASDLIKFECRRMVTNVDDNNTEAPTGPKYSISIAKFGGGSPEELLEFLKMVFRVFEGQAIDIPRDRHNLMQQVLTGDALAAFNNKSEELGVMTTVNFHKCIRHLKEHIFPDKALAYQKRYMRNAFKLPAGWSIKRYVARIVEINNYLPEFPPFEQDQKLQDDEILELVKYGIPVKWQHALLQQESGGREKDLSEVVKFCERQMHIEGKRVTYDSENLRSLEERIPRKRNASEYGMYPSPSELWCDFCGKKGHSMIDCRHYKKAKMEHSSMSTYKTPYSKKNSYFKKPTYKKEYSGKAYHKSKHPGEKVFNKEEVKVMMDRRERKVRAQYEPRAKKPEAYNMESDEESMPKRKMDFSSSDESKGTGKKSHKSSDDSSDSDDESRLSHYGFEDRDDLVFGNKKDKDKDNK